jgi:hypothetical protein
MVAAPNYNQRRKDIARSKQEKKERKQQALQERDAQRKSKDSTISDHPVEGDKKD